MLQMSAKAYHKKMKGCWVTLNILSVFIEENTQTYMCAYSFPLYMYPKYQILTLYCDSIVMTLAFKL